MVVNGAWAAVFRKLVANKVLNMDISHGTVWIIYGLLLWIDAFLRGFKILPPINYHYKAYLRYSKIYLRLCSWG